MFICHILVTSLFLPCAEQQTPREYVIREVMPPRYKDSRYKFDWQATWFSGDSDVNDEADFMLWGQWVPEAFSGLTGENHFEFHTGIDPSSLTAIVDPQNTYSFSLGQWALLKTPTGFQAIIQRVGLGPNTGLISFDWDSGLENGIIPFATGFPNPIPDAGKFESILPAGDQNGDGYEDFFWTNYLGTGTGYSYCGLYDGATLTSIWQYAEGKSGGVVIPYTVSPSTLPDLNGDTFSDFLVGIPHFNLQTGAWSHEFIAFSGQDGSIIWTAADQGWMGAHYGFGPDLTGDGVPDAIFMVRDSLDFRALDSTDGTEIWVTPTSSLRAQYGSDQVGGLATWRGFMSNLDQPTLQEYVNYHWINHLATSEIAFAHYDAYDGTFLGSFPIPTSLEPWSPDTSFATDTRGPMRLGDIDRDGLEEIGIPFDDWQRSPGWSTNGSNPQPGTQLAIIGLRTLFVPEIHQLGSGNLDFDIAVPAGVNKTFAIILSTEFDPYGGVEIGPWKTFLAPSPILTYTMTNRNLIGALDGNGKGSIGVAIPAHPALLGKILYSKALVLNQSGSPELIQTLSSMGITELQ